KIGNARRGQVGLKYLVSSDRRKSLPGRIVGHRLEISNSMPPRQDNFFVFVVAPHDRCSLRTGVLPSQLQRFRQLISSAAQMDRDGMARLGSAGCLDARWRISRCDSADFVVGLVAPKFPYGPLSLLQRRERPIRVQFIWRGKA